MAVQAAAPDQGSLQPGRRDRVRRRLHDRVAVLCGWHQLAVLGLATASPFAVAQAQQPAPQGESIVASVEAKATVAKVDRETREITLRTADGQESSFIAGDEVQNFGQINQGDVVTVTDGEALAYQVRKGGETVAPETTMAGAAAEPGAKPAGFIGRQTTVTVKITAIDRTVPTVTFTGPAGNSRTIKVLRPEKLEGVSVGDTVEMTYTEAVAITVDEAAR